MTDLSGRSISAKEILTFAIECLMNELEKVYKSFQCVTDDIESIVLVVPQHWTTQAVWCLKAAFKQVGFVYYNPRIKSRVKKGTVPL